MVPSFFFFFGVFTNTYAWFVKGVKSNTFSQNSHILCLRLCSHVFIQCKSVSGMITWVGVLKKMLQIFLIQNKILFHYMNFPKFCSKQDKMCACGSLTLYFLAVFSVPNNLPYCSTGADFSRRGEHRGICNSNNQ